MKIDNNVITPSLNSESACKLVNRIPGSCLLISSVPGSALRTHVESLGKPRGVNKRSQSLACYTRYQRHSPCILYVVSKKTSRTGSDIPDQKNVSIIQM